MGKRIMTKIGDVFSVELGNGNKKYFQYVINDLMQLNSDVIRAFKKEYPFKDNINYSELQSGEIDFHAHTMINIGAKLNFFHQEGKHDVFPDISNIIFRDTNDYGHKEGEESVKISNKWYVWRIGDEKSTYVGELTGENRKAEIGIVIPPYAIVDRIRTGRFDFVYPDFE